MMRASRGEGFQLTNRDYKVCSRCVMDTTIPSIRFDDQGVCNYCHMHDLMAEEYPLDEGGEKKLWDLVEKVKRDGEGKRYDVILGTSGGRDSTYTMWVTKNILGLRPLAVHFDNGWNSAIAVKNIERSCRKLDIDLETVVADWEEFRDIQIAFLRASTPDVEVPTDVAIHAVMHRLAAQEGIKYIFNGHSFRTEGIAPIDWTYMDGRYIQQVMKRFSDRNLRDYANFTLWDYFNYSFLKEIKVVPVLNYFHYEHAAANELLENELGWQYYGGHHEESTYTKFIQSYLLPKKFNIDRRRTEQSALIRSEYTTRKQALDVVEGEYKYDETLIDYVAEKFDLTPAEFQALYDLEPKSFRDYPSYFPYIRMAKGPLWLASKMGLIPQLLYLKFNG